MDDIENDLRRRRDGFEPTLARPEGLDEAIRRGRRKIGRRAGLAGALTGLAVVAVTSAGLTAPGGASPEIDPVTRAPAATDARPQPGASASSGATPTPPLTASEPVTSSEVPTTPPADKQPAERAELQLDLTFLGSGADPSYADGQPVTMRITACNGTDEPHDEFFFNEGHRFDLRIFTADDRAIAHTNGREYDSQWVVEVWQPGECRSWTETWDQTEGWFDDPDDGPDAEPGEYTVELSWTGVEPPPAGIEVGLYDPAARPIPPVFGPFTIEEPAGEDPFRLPGVG